MPTNHDAPPPPPPPPPPPSFPLRKQMSCSAAEFAPPKHSHLRKQLSWSPDILREEAWQRRKENKNRVKQNEKMSVTDDDMEELKACFELGFGFDYSSEVDPRLSDAFPALDLYYAVNKNYSNCMSRTSSDSSLSSDTDVESTSSIIDPEDDPEIVKSKLRQWAQVVACSVKQSFP